MNLDIRWPMGILFFIFGVLLIGYGWAVPTRSIAGANPNLLWGGVLALFGLCMIGLARRAAKRH